ncbi:RNA-directed DNA polymerase from mobile element jockey [Araneus ventricosus]|uniref:RNA-directed DNA polymerase from mobile element jockey n=1 Tax=Araneus ventricosus TaxID=182803 RepID=A0A4Y2PZX0_ARAVE|nr:RNA-directed DNA polymerase from mobile element jockey [Araneus ventricosus]
MNCLLLLSLLGILMVIAQCGAVRIQILVDDKLRSLLILTPFAYLTMEKTPTSINEVELSTLLDLSLCTPSLAPYFNFRVGVDLRDSDHFPIFLDRVNVGSNDAQYATAPIRYLFHRADWTNFTLRALITRNMVEGENLNEVVNLVTKTIISAADASIPKSGLSFPRNRKPWWNKYCTDTNRDQRRAWNVFRRHPTSANQIAFQRAKSISRWARRKSERGLWIKFVSSINSSVTAKDMWENVRRACASNYTEPFLTHKNRMERIKLRFQTTKHLSYNTDLTIVELHTALSVIKHTSPGPDEVTYSMLQHLSEHSLLNILYMFNRIWKEHVFPDCWKHAFIIPIPKPGKDPQDPLNYRPIALTSCMCKLFERIVNVRLVHILEMNEYISPFQSGFRKSRSTIDNLISLETDIRVAFLKRNNLVSIFFDIYKAYDRTWRYGIMKNLYDLGFRGNLPIFVQNFLKQRFFRVRLGNTFSNIFCQEEGVPQGCVLSVTLFVLAINPILSVIPQTVQKSLYVDDLHISCYARNMQLIERQLQTAINNVVEWSNKSGFTISAQKTIGIHFCKRPLHPDPELSLSGVPIRFQDNYKFLGIVFDKRLTFLPHIASLRKRCLRSLNILRTLSNTSWGADRSCLLRVYRSIIRSMIDYGSVVYGSARPSYLKRLGYVHHQALRLCLGAFRTSPIPSLYAEAFEPSSSSRRDKLPLSYYFRILSNDKHPLRGTLLNSNNNRLFNVRPSCIPHFGLRMRNILPDTFHGVKVHTNDFCGHPPWMENSISYINPFGNFTKSDSNNSVLISLFNQHRQFYQSYQPVFTDGSKSLNHVGCAFFTNGHIISYKLHSFTSVFSSEITAVYFALKYIDEHEIRKSILYTDSMSLLESLRSSSTRNPLIKEVKDFYRQLLSKGARIHSIFMGSLPCWHYRK